MAASALGACGGGGSGTHSVVPGGPTTTPAQRGRLSFTFTIPKKTSHRTRVPAYVSASTQAVVVIVSSQATGQTTTDVLPCTSTCAGSIAAPTGVDTVTFKLLDKPPVAGSPPTADPTAKVLAIGSLVTLIVPDTDNVIKATLDGVVKNVTMALAPATVNAGTPANTFLIVNAYDPDDNLITLNGAWIDASGTPVVVGVTAPVANILGGVSGSLISVSAPGVVIPVAGTLASGSYQFTAVLRSGAPTVTTIAPATLIAQPSVVFGTTPFIPRSSLQFYPFTLNNGTIGLGYLSAQQTPQIIIGDVLGRAQVIGPVYPGSAFSQPVPEPGLIDFDSTGGGDQAFVLASGMFVAASAPPCTGPGELADYSGPINPSNGSAPFTLCDDGSTLALRSADTAYPVPGQSFPFPAAFIAAPNGNANAWCGAASCLVFGDGRSGVTSMVTDLGAAVGTSFGTGPGDYAAYDFDRAIAINPQGMVYQLALSTHSATPLYQSGVFHPDAVCRTADGSATVVLGTTIAGGTAQPQVGVYRNGTETLGPIPPSPGQLSFVSGSNCRFATEFSNVDAVLF